jgi:iron complex outermembrane receptor protein
VDNWQIVFGVDGKLPNGWSWDLSYSYGDFVSNERNTFRGNVRKMQNLLDPTLCAADPSCVTAVGAAGAWDPFHRGTLTPEMQAYGLASLNDTIQANLKIMQFNLSGDTEMFGLELPGGPISWALGYEYRREDSGTFPDGASLTGDIYNVQGGVTKGHYSTHEQYFEISLPVLANMPFAELLTVEGSVRHFNYTTVGSGITLGAKVEWAPVEDARIRYVYNEGFRAPNIGELFLAEQETAAAYSEPCENWDTLYAPGSAEYVNCGTNDNLPLGWDLTSSSQAMSLQGGNSDLEEEQSKSHTVGLVLTPRWVEGLSVTMDYFRIDIENVIGAAGVDIVIGECYASLNFTSPLCALLEGPTLVGETPSLQAPARRNVLNQLSGINLRNENLAAFETRGIDFGAEYSFETPLGELGLQLSGTWLEEFGYVPLPGFSPTQLAGHYGTDPYQGDSPAAFPEWQLGTAVTLTGDSWGVAWTTDYMSTVQGLDSSLRDHTAGSRWYNNLSAYYRWNAITARVGIRNVGDVNPPYVTDYDDMNTIQYSYETAGRYVYARVGYDF